MREQENVLYNENCALDAYLPLTDRFTTIVYFHGGGMVEGDKADEPTKAFAEAVVKEGYAFISANYRMYTDGAKFPDFLQDAAQAVAYAKENYANKLGNGKLIISGQSAGAWIASMLCVDKQWLAAVGIDAEEIDAWLIDSAQMSSHFRLLEMEEKITPWVQRIDKYAPLYYIDQGVKVSPMFITYYEKDMLCRAEQNEMFIKALKFFDREADVTGYLLHGGHCHGTSQKDEDGQYEFLKKAVTWMKERGL